MIVVTKRLARLIGSASAVLSPFILFIACYYQTKLDFVLGMSRLHFALGLDNRRNVGLDTTGENYV